jgi:hypothetical protein
LTRCRVAKSSFSTHGSSTNSQTNSFTIRGKENNAR